MYNSFVMYRDDKRRKLIKIKDDSIWMITIDNDKWSTNMSRLVSYWTERRTRGDNKYILKDCKVERVFEDIEDIKTYCCCCNRNFSSRSYLVKHAKKCKPSQDLIQTENITNTRISHCASTENIRVRNYGEENPRWFTKNLMYHIMGDINNAIPKLVEHKHFNDSFPENKNLKLENRKTINKRLRVFENGRWKTRKTKQTFYKVIIDIHDILCDALEKDDDSDSEGDVIEGIVPEEDHVGNEIRKLRKMETFAVKLNKIKPIWEGFRDKIGNQEDRTDLWEDLKTFLLDRQLQIEQGIE
jgi:hypothetical protein